MLLIKDTKYDRKLTYIHINYTRGKSEKYNPYVEIFNLQIIKTQLYVPKFSVK